MTVAEKAETPVDVMNRRVAFLERELRDLAQELKRVDKRRQELQATILRTDGAIKELGALSKSLAYACKPEPPLVDKPPMLENSKPADEAPPVEVPKES